MSFHPNSAGRIHAIAVSFLTFSLHVILIHSAFSSSSAGFRATPFFAAYNVAAAGASIAGLYGAVKMNPALLSAYSVAHTITLLLGTLTLLDIILPIDLTSFVPTIPSLDFDVLKLCVEIDGSFGWDEGWLDRCAASVRVVKAGAAWIGLVLLSAQWWAARRVWRWSHELREEQRYVRMSEKEERDVEKAYYLDEKIEFSDVR